MNIDLLNLAKECPGLTITISINDLIEANNRLIEETRLAFDNGKTAQEPTCLSRESVMERLGVSSATLWRWAKSGYLVPVNVGGQRRYRSSDINSIMEGER